MKPHAMPRCARLVTTTALVGILATGCGTTDGPAASPVGTDTPTAIADGTDAPTPSDADAGTSEPRVVTADEGAAARRRYEPLKRSADAAAGALVADASMLDCPGTYVPTPEEVAEANTANEGLIDAFDRFGIEYTSSADGLGYIMVDYAYDDVVAQSVADSYWNAAYPPIPIPQADLDANIAQNDIVAEQPDAAGVTYERSTDDSGYETLEYDYENPAAQSAVDAAWKIISPPQPPTAEQLAQQTADNDKLMNAFDDAGIAYELLTDELGWAWIEWDAEDPDTSEKYYAILDELYPPISIEPIEECEFVEEPIAIDLPTVDVEAVDPLVDPMPVEELDEVVVDGAPTPEQIALRDAEVDVMVAGFGAASMTFEVLGESPWQTVGFDLDDDASVSVISDVLAARS